MDEKINARRREASERGRSEVGAMSERDTNHDVGEMNSGIIGDRLVHVQDTIQ